MCRAELYDDDAPFDLSCILDIPMIDLLMSPSNVIPYETVDLSFDAFVNSLLNEN